MTKTLKKSDPVEPEVIDPQAVDNEDAPIDKGAIPDKDLEKHMTQRQILFCKYYVSDQEVFCNGTQSYAKAYGYDLELEPEKYKACQGSASVLLSNHIISRYINKLLTNIIPDE